MITGNGLKDIRGALSAIGRPILVKPEISAIREAIDAAEHTNP